MVTILPRTGLATAWRPAYAAVSRVVPLSLPVIITAAPHNHNNNQSATYCIPWDRYWIASVSPFCNCHNNGGGYDRMKAWTVVMMMIIKRRREVEEGEKRLSPLRSSSSMTVYCSSCDAAMILSRLSPAPILTLPCSPLRLPGPYAMMMTATSRVVVGGYAVARNSPWCTRSTK
jgi:hypothetical protein